MAGRKIVPTKVGRMTEREGTADARARAGHRTGEPDEPDAGEGCRVALGSEERRGNRGLR